MMFTAPIRLALAKNLPHMQCPREQKGQMLMRGCQWVTSSTSNVNQRLAQDEAERLYLAG